MTALAEGITSPQRFFGAYGERLQRVLATADWDCIARLAEDLRLCWRNGRRVFLCGNGGSGANALHLANDLHYGISKADGMGLKVSALTGNVSVLTCLANDEGYDRIFSLQLAVQAEPGDMLIVFSGSGNSPNIVAALDKAREMGVRSVAILGYSGGSALERADNAIHFDCNDMQICEDLQMIIGHMIIQWLFFVGKGRKE